ncbi:MULTISPECIES: spinster family MFS transporter [unclassified Sphingomonas]|uniref:spinster family MFS transporter n=1 Tax=unclassified Sphingomonas TaxID=196159 RepID=UPI0006FC7E8A|nr:MULTISPECIES: MFS transporter [unclassified Sphingomonas]KQM26629.1 MFS transporter [Sphingomonas sp. Leaf9]KQM43035.1 MFS transporter [Sphingomonas sp. Leaf11]
MKNPRITLAMLLLVYSFNFLDRQILSILAQPVQRDLGLDDGQMGMLGGLAFAALYSTLAIPLALIADRTSRTWVITISLGVWSAFTALCGTAQNFTQMFLFRLGVGVGEAGGVAPSYALIADTFPPERRARALAIYSLGIPLGAAGGVLLGGYIAQAVEWRTAFYTVGLAGLVIAPFFRLLVKDPPRAAASADRIPVGRVFGILARKPSFWLMAFGAAAGSMCGYGVAFWLPSLMMRSFGLDLIQTGQFFGALLLTGGVAGILLGGSLGDRLGQRNKRWYALLPALCYVLGTPLFIAGVLSSGWVAAFALFLLPQALVYVWLGPVLTAVQHLVPAHMRATASACFLLINNLIGLGLGSWVVGQLSKGLAPTYGTESLRYAIAGALCLYLVAGALMALASRRLSRDWVA